MLKTVTDLRPSVRVPKTLEKFHASMAGKGFNLVHSPENNVLGFREPLYVYDRACGTKSSFSVLVLLEGNRIWVDYADPLAPDKGGLALKRDEIFKSANYKYGFSERWVTGAAGEIEKTSKNKPENSSSVVVHDHWGFFHDESLMKLGFDDGMSKTVPILLNLKRRHVDVVCISSHNHIHLGLFDEVDAITKQLKMIAVPGFEVTMPVWLYENEEVEKFRKDLQEKLGVPLLTLPRRANGTYAPKDVEALILAHKTEIEQYNSDPLNLDKIGYPTPAPNGPHVLVHCANRSIAAEIQQEHLSNRFHDYPPLASKIEMEAFLSAIKKYGKGAVVILAHASGGSDKLPASISLLNCIEQGMITREEVLRLMSEYFHGVSFYAPANSAKFVHDKFSKENAAYFSALLEKANKKLQRKIGSKFTENALNMAFALEMNELGIPMYLDHDEHYYPPMKIGRSKVVCLLDAGCTLMRYGENEQQPQTSEDVIRAMHEAREGRRMIEALAYYALNRDGVPQTVDERTRREILDTFAAAWSEFRVYGLEGVKRLWSSAVKIIKNGRPDSPRELWYDLTRISK